jgi:hypothetical protein
METIKDELINNDNIITSWSVPPSVFLSNISCSDMMPRVIPLKNCDNICKMKVFLSKGLMLLENFRINYQLVSASSLCFNTTFNSEL